MNTQANRQSPTTSEFPQQTRLPQGVSSGQMQPVDDMLEYVTTYAKQNPGTAALWCFGIGFVVGWRLKPW